MNSEFNNTVSVLEHSGLRRMSLKIITFAAIAVLIFSIFLIFLNENEGVSHALLSVDTSNEEKIIQKGNIVIHNITVTNEQSVGGKTVRVILSGQIISVSMGGNASNWSIKFTDGVNYINYIDVDATQSKTIGVEVFAPNTAVLHETAITRITGEDGFLPIAGPLNSTNCQQNGEIGSYLELKTTVGQNYEPRIGIDGEYRKVVNPDTPTIFRVKVTNYGLKVDSYTLTYLVGSPIRGETRAGDKWRVTFSPSAYIGYLNSMDYTFVYVNVTSPSNAVFGEYPITITAVSHSSNSVDSSQLIGVVPLPDLYANPLTGDDFSRFPVMDGQEMTINLTIYNDGGTLENDFNVNFWIEDTQKPGSYNIIGTVKVGTVMYRESTSVTITFSPELHPKTKERLTEVEIKIEIDADSEIIESDEDNNVVIGKLEILKAGKTTSGYSASIWLVVGIVTLSVVLAAGAEWNRRRKKDTY